MATRTASSKTSRPMKIQRKINQDFMELGRDYVDLGAAILRKPLTKYVLAGVGLFAVGPYLLKALKKIPMTEALLESPVESIKNVWNSGLDTVSESAEDISAH